jgi:chloramphenicol 3-O-phosphotransferase
MNQFLIILRGTPASGKTTIARTMRNFENKIVWLKVDNFKDFFAEDSSIALKFVNGSAVATMSYLFDEGFSVVMDGVFQDTSAITDAVKIASERNIKNIVYEIECSLESLQERDRTREGVKEGFRKPLGDETIESIYKILKDSPYSNAQTINTENKTIEECLGQIKNDLSQ